MIYLGIDIGTTSAKCLAVSEDGDIVALAQHPYPMRHPRQGWAEQDPEDYWDALVATVRQCVEESGRDVAAISLSTQGDTLIVTDSAGVPLRPAISWMDTRGEVEYRELLAEGAPEFWYEETGLPLDPTSSACSLRWIRGNEPDTWRRIGHVSYVPDYLAFRLTGRFVADIPSASWNPLYNPSSRARSRRIMDILGIADGQVSETIESGNPIGAIRPEVADELGLPRSTVLVSGAFDQAAAALGSGASPGDRSVLSCGTAWVLYSVAAQPIRDPDERIPICCHTSQSQWGMVLPFTGGAAYDWANGILTPDDDSRASEADPLIFIPHLYGGLCPDWRSESRGSLLGLTTAHTARDIRLAVMRGVACEARRNVEAAERLSGPIGSIRMVGGAGKSDTWPQLVADVLGKPVEVADCVESACYGAAKLAAGPRSDAWHDPGTLRAYEPGAEEGQFYERYVRAYHALLGVYEHEQAIPSPLEGEG